MENRHSSAWCCTVACQHSSVNKQCVLTEEEFGLEPVAEVENHQNLSILPLSGLGKNTYVQHIGLMSVKGGKTWH